MLRILWGILYWLTLPFFFGIYGGLLALEGIYWLLFYPRDAWNFIKRSLGITK